MLFITQANSMIILPFHWKSGRKVAWQQWFMGCAWVKPKHEENFIWRWWTNWKEFSYLDAYEYNVDEDFYFLNARNHRIWWV